MKQAKYRVEAFIIPVCINNNTNSVLSDTRDERLQLNDVSNVTVSIEKTEAICVENNISNSLTIEEESIQNAKNSITLERLAGENKNRTSNFDYSSKSVKTKYEASYNTSFASNIFDRVERLTPIDEQNEDAEGKITDLCYHGCRNGCSAVVPTPQEVSEEIFKENWLQKLENIKQKEAELKNREVILCNRERALIKKEEEIRILECQLNDKLKQLDLDLKTNKHIRDLMKLSCINKHSRESLIDVDSKTLQQEKHKNDVKTDITCVDHLNLCMENIRTHGSNKELSNNIGNISKDLQEKRSSGSSSSSSDHSVSDGKKYKQRPTFRSSATLKSSGSRTVSNNSNKIKRPTKICYEDLDTTLSADIGDSSFVQTSQKFNPELYRKPYAFTRSASERRGKYQSKGSSMNLQVKNLTSIWEEFDKPVGMEQDKVLQRVTKNISVSQDKSTKFQNYGLIDNNISTTNTEHKIENEEKYSYLNLETGSKLCLHQRLMKNSKDNRPVSWNEETNEWLQKKRKAYMTTKKIPTKDTEDKENHKCNTKSDRTDKVLKKNDIKSKILTIFR
ncbi:uncharacterized protein LOC143356940 [Halictus rubicundus]|uniref:uncharacterized protein LOC143356940 n=1 Tax=Halictus rubicundus TaxID=77578 RepID=UPI0040365BD9